MSGLSGVDNAFTWFIILACSYSNGTHVVVGWRGVRLFAKHDGQFVGIGECFRSHKFGELKSKLFYVTHVWFEIWKLQWSCFKLCHILWVDDLGFLLRS